ncbi:hypothetical protein D3C87_1531540 [compost metagenome]
MPKHQEQTFETNLHRKRIDWQVSFLFAVRLSLSKTDNKKKPPISRRLSISIAQLISLNPSLISVQELVGLEHSVVVCYLSSKDLPEQEPQFDYPNHHPQ